MQAQKENAKYTLFPEIEAHQSGYLQVTDLHSLYYEISGNPEGVPVVFLHGGPGGGVQPKYRRFFDPEYYKIILFDQRGAGKSRPHAELTDNTTWDLVADIEMLRETLGVSQWLVFGGSWGSTLALSYAIRHPDRASGLILRGIFLCRPQEIQWFYQDGASWLYPDAWEKYRDVIPEAERRDFVKAYYKRLTDADATVRTHAARAWSTWEAGASKLIPDPSTVAAFDQEEFALAFARIECHYFSHNTFFETDNYLLENIDAIRHIPGYIVHGRYDVVCPVRSAWDLHRAWPESHLEIVPDAGHSALEPGILHQLISFTEAFKTKVQAQS